MKKVKAAKKPKINDAVTLFHINFGGEFVEILTKFKAQLVRRSELGEEVSETYIARQGYVVDVDEQYVYIGEADPIKINCAINRSDILTIDIIEENQKTPDPNDVLGDFNDDDKKNMN